MVACCFGGGRRFSRHFCIFRKHLKMMPCWSLLVPTRISAWNVVHVCTPTILNCCTWVHVDSLTRTFMPPLHMSFSDSFIFFCDSFIVIHLSLSLSLSLSLCLSVSLSLSLSLSVCFLNFFSGFNVVRHSCSSKEKRDSGQKSKKEKRKIRVKTIAENLRENLREKFKNCVPLV